MRSLLIATVIATAVLSGCSSDSILKDGNREPYLVFITQPDSVKTGVVISPSVRVAIKDADGNVITTASDTIVISLDSNRFEKGTLAGTLVVPVSNGIATFADLSVFSRPWSYDGACCGYTLRASAKGMASATSEAFYVDYGPPAQLGFSIQPPKSITADADFGVSLALLDGAGNGLRNSAASVTLTLAANPGGAVLGGPYVTRLTQYGTVGFSVTVNRPGTGYTLRASAEGLTSAVSIPFDVLPQATASHRTP